MPAANGDFRSASAGLPFERRRIRRRGDGARHHLHSRSGEGVGRDQARGHAERHNRHLCVGLHHGGSPHQPLREAVEAKGMTVVHMRGTKIRGWSTDEFLVSRRRVSMTSRPHDRDRGVLPDFDAFWASQTALANTAVQDLRKMSAREVEQLKTHLREHLPKDRSAASPTRRGPAQPKVACRA